MKNFIESLKETELTINESAELELNEDMLAMISGGAEGTAQTQAQEIMINIICIEIPF